MFSADKSFLAGIFGRQNNKINSLGFILYKKFTNESNTPLTWPGFEDLFIETYEIKGETEKVCNTTDLPTDVIINYPTTSGN